MRPLLLVFAVAAPLMAAIPAGASQCVSIDAYFCNMIQITPGTPEQTFYIDDRGLFGEGLWIYEETNGIWDPKLPGVYWWNLYPLGSTMSFDADLQRGGCSELFEDCDWCRISHGCAEFPDRLIY